MPSNTPPWQHRKWRNGIVRPSVWGQTLLLWFFALVFTGVGIPMYLKEPALFHWPPKPDCWVLLFPATGLLMAQWYEDALE